MKKPIVFSLAVLMAAGTLQPIAHASFPDVPDSHLNADAIDYLQEQQTVEGYPSGNFEPTNRIKRVEMMKIVAKELYTDEEIEACDVTKLSFPDWDPNAWYAKPVCILVENGIVSGRDDGTLDPSGYTNFAEISKILAEANKLEINEDGTEQWYQKYVDALAEENAIPSTIDRFNKDVTRADMAESQYRLSADVTDKVSLTYEEIVEPLPALSSCDALQEKFHDFQYGGYYPLIEDREEAVMDEDLAAPPADAEAGAPLPSPTGDLGAGDAFNEAPTMAQSGGGGEKQADFSETNVQVEGVDEADIIKNDGEFIYLLKGDTVRIVKATPVDEMEEVNRIDFNEDGSDQGFYPSEMFIAGDKLVVMGQASNYYYAKPMVANGAAELSILPPFYQNDQMKVFVYQLSPERTVATATREVSFDGSYHTSRRIGDQLYLVLNMYPYYWDWSRITNGRDILPTLKDGDKPTEVMAECDEVRYFPGNNHPNYLIVASLDINDRNSDIKREVMLGSSENVYSSKTDLYVANTYVDYNYYGDWDWSTDEAKSYVYRFALNDGDLRFVDRGEVPGRALNQFSMDQYNNHFRIATTTGDAWNDFNPPENNVYVLNASMDQVGALEGLAPGERIYSTRFIGDRLYMVTFEQVDPLFVIDMSNPNAPKVLGQLKIPGFSEYLHPYDEDHIIGFGRETSLGKNGVQLEGLKLGMFDVSDPNNPKQKFVEVIGDSGTYSELLYNHKALLFDKERGLMAFPIEIVEKVEAQDNVVCSEYTYDTCPNTCVTQCIPSDCTTDAQGNEVCTSDCDGPNSCVDPGFDWEYEQYQTTFSGALVYDVSDTTGFKELGRITHYEDEDIDEIKLGYFWPYDYNKNIQRIVRIGEVLYSVAQGGVKASDIQSVDELNYIELESDGEEDGQVFPVDVLF